MKNIYKILGFLIVVAIAIVLFTLFADKSKTSEVPENIPNSILIKGELKEINKGCAYDVRCTITIDDKVIMTDPGHVTKEYIDELIKNGSGNTTDIVELEKQGKLKESGHFILAPKDKTMVEAFVHVHENGELSIYGSNQYYVRIVK